MPPEVVFAEKLNVLLEKCLVLVEGNAIIHTTEYQILFLDTVIAENHKTDFGVPLDLMSLNVMCLLATQSFINLQIRTYRTSISVQYFDIWKFLCNSPLTNIKQVANIHNRLCSSQITNIVSPPKKSNFFRLESKTFNNKPTIAPVLR